jgi:hypothetical protein
VITKSLACSVPSVTFYSVIVLEPFSVIMVFAPTWVDAAMITLRV